MNAGRIYKAVTIATVVIVILCALYIMAARLGLAEGLDFGAGAYYYEKVIRDDVYQTSVPYWVHVVLFLAWGWLMYRLWVWIDSRGTRKNGKKHDR